MKREPSIRINCLNLLITKQKFNYKVVSMISCYLHQLCSETSVLLFVIKRRVVRGKHMEILQAFLIDDVHSIRISLIYRLRHLTPH